MVRSGANNRGRPDRARRLNVGSGPYGVAVDPSTHTAYVTNSLSNTVSVITSPIPPGPGTLAFAHTS